MSAAIERACQSGLYVVEWFTGAEAKSLCFPPINNNRAPNWRASSQSCYCAATHAPCWTCENSAECVECSSFEIMDEMLPSKHGLICTICEGRRRP